MNIKYQCCLLMVLFFSIQIYAQSENKFLVGLEYSGLGISMLKSNESRKGPLDMTNLNLQYNFGKKYSLLFGIGKRKIGAFRLDPIFDKVNVSAFLKNEIRRNDIVRVNPSFNVFTLGISMPTFKCNCIHQTLNYDLLWRRKAEIPAEYLESEDVDKKLYKNVLSGFRYGMQFKIAFPNSGMRIYFGPSVAILGGTKVVQNAPSDLRIGVTMGAQYLIGRSHNKF